MADKLDSLIADLRAAKTKGEAAAILAGADEATLAAFEQLSDESLQQRFQAAPQAGLGSGLQAALGDVVKAGLPTALRVGLPVGAAATGAGLPLLALLGAGGEAGAELVQEGAVSPARTAAGAAWGLPFGSVPKAVASAGLGDVFSQWAETGTVNPTRSLAAAAGGGLLAKVLGPRAGKVAKTEAPKPLAAALEPSRPTMTATMPVGPSVSPSVDVLATFGRGGATPLAAPTARASEGILGRLGAIDEAVAKGQAQPKLKVTAAQMTAHRNLTALGVPPEEAQKIALEFGGKPLTPATGTATANRVERALTPLRGSENPAIQDALKGLDLMGAAYDAAKRASAGMGEQRKLAALWDGLSRDVAKRYGAAAAEESVLKTAQETLAPKAGLKSQAGGIDPKLATALGKSAVGGTVGGMLGQEADPEHPDRGLALGILAGATVGAHPSKTLNTLGKVAPTAWLSSPINLLAKNPVSQALFGLYRTMAVVPEAGFDFARSALTGAPRTVRAGELGPRGRVALGAARSLLGAESADPTNIAVRAGLGRASHDAWEVLTTGKRPSKVLFKTGAGESMDYAKEELAGGFLTNLPTRVLDAMDTWQRGLFEEMAKAGTAFTELVNETGVKPTWAEIGRRMASPSEAMLKQAAAEGAELTFKGPLSSAAQAVMRLKNDYPVLNFFVPYVGSLENITKSGLNMTPLAPLYRMSRGQAAFTEGRKGVEQMTDVAFGSLVGTAAATAYMNGLVSGPLPLDQTDRDLWAEQGRTAWSVRVGDQWVRMTSLLGPFSVPVMMAVSAADALDKQTIDEEGYRQAVTNSILPAAGTALRGLTDLSFLNGLARFAQAAVDPGRMQAYWTDTMAGIAQPVTALRDIARWRDPIRRDVSTEGWWAQFGNEIATRVPGLKEQLPPSVGILGPQQEGGGLTSPVRHDPALDLITSLGLRIGAPSGSLTVDDVKVPLTQAEEGENALIKAATTRKLLTTHGPEMRARLSAGDIEGARRVFERQRSRSSRQTSKLLQQLRAPQIATAKAKAKAEIQALLHPQK